MIERFNPNVANNDGGTFLGMEAVEDGEYVRYSDCVSVRDRILSHFAWLVGGWNATQGVHAGRLAGEPGYNDDEQVARLILNAHKHDIQSKVDRLLEEVARQERLSWVNVELSNQLAAARNERDQLQKTNEAMMKNIEWQLSGHQ